MWSGGRSKDATHHAVPRLKLLHRLRRRRYSILCAVEALLDWLRSTLTLAGTAHLAALAVLVVQTSSTKFYLSRYLSDSTSLTLAAEIPLILHLIWFWREESAARAAPTEWVVYSWVHAAKVVVLFCKVMPRLPTSGHDDKMSIGGFSTAGVTFGELGSPTNLTNLLLLTPVLYALLMFRVSKAIFGSFSNQITVDLLMHYDMLWHVVIDMVDQVDMFAYARLAEWVRKDVLEKHKSTITTIQTVIPFLLFLSITLQAQSFPGVVVDSWRIPEPPPPEEAERRPSDTEAPSSPARGAATSGAGEHPSSPSRAVASHCSEGSSMPAFRPSGLGEDFAASGSRSTGAVERPSSPPPAPQPQFRSAPVVSIPSSSSVSPTASAKIRASGRATQDVAGTASTSARPKRNSGSKHRPLRSGGKPESLLGSGGGARLRPGMDSERAQSKRVEKRRKRMLQAIIHHIQRQNIIVARKRSAVISIFFVDLPFLALRITLWVLTLREGRSDFPALGVKNGICILLNALQYTLVRLASRDAFIDIQQRLAVYHCLFPSPRTSGVSSSPSAGDPPDSGPGSRMPAATASPVMGPAAALGNSPAMSDADVMPHLSPLHLAADPRDSPMVNFDRGMSLHSRAKAHHEAAKAQELKREMERRVRQETTRSSSVCVHFWAIFFAFGAGFLLAKGEGFFLRISKVAQDVWLTHVASS